MSEIVFEDNPDGKLNINTHCFACSQLKKLVLPNTALRLSLEFVHENPSLESVVFSYGDSISFGGDNQTVYMVECCFAQSRNLINKCANLKEVVSLNPLPPVIHESGRKMGPYFVHITDQLETAVLRVPKGSEELYRADAVWGEFKNIQGFDPGEYDGIGTVDAVNEPEAAKAVKVCVNADGIKVALDKGIVKVYNAQGALVMQARHDGGIFTADLPKGIYIVSVR